MMRMSKPKLFQFGAFKLHSGAWSPWKIDCDAITDDELLACAELIALNVRFSEVEGVPTGGTRLAMMLRRWRLPPSQGAPLLIVDDVLTTGASMEELRAGRDAIGVVLFARGKCPRWVTPLFKMPEDWA